LLHSPLGGDNVQLKHSSPVSFVLVFMQRASYQSRMLRSGTLLAALLAVLWYAPLPAHASCGDYVTVATPHGTKPAVHPSGMPQSGGPSRPPGTRGQQPSLPPCQQCPFRPAAPGNPPCQGPWCSGSHLPMAPPTTTVERSSEQCALCETVTLLSHPEPIPRAFLRDQADRVHHVSPIYRPPRTA
jgi:hypothetical protein